MTSARCRFEELCCCRNDRWSKDPYRVGAVTTGDGDVSAALGDGDEAAKSNFSAKSHYTGLQN